MGVGALPVYAHGYARADASLRWRMTSRVSIMVEGTNLLRTMRRSYYGVPTRPDSNWLNDRQIDASIVIRL